MKRHTQELRILVADDHALFRRGIRALLHDQRGWRVVGEAGSGREAVDQAQRLKPDVAILDVTMPDLDGLEATRQLRQTAPDTKVLILTMHESKQMFRLLAAGKANKEIAMELGMSVRTVETHRAKIMLKLGLNSLPQIVQYAVRNDLISF